MQVLKYVLTIFCIATFIGCTSQTYVIMDDYKGKELSANHLMVGPYSVHIFNKDDVVDDLGSGVAEEVFQKYFDSTFAASIKKSSRISSLSFGKKYTNNNFIDRVLTINDKENIKLSLPKDGNIIEIDSIKPDYILFIDNYSIERYAGSSGVVTPGGFGQAPMTTGGSFGGLMHQLDFAMWDNNKCKIVSFGRVEAKSSVVFGMTKGNWKDCVKGLALKIVHASPFYSKPTGQW